MGEVVVYGLAVVVVVLPMVVVVRGVRYCGGGSVASVKEPADSCPNRRRVLGDDGAGQCAERFGCGLRKS